MGLFGWKSNAGGFMDQIRCDESSYLIWKWHPYGSNQGKNNRENAIRWGSSLRVKEGEVAVFVYNQPDGVVQDFIEGPYDALIETDNMPVLAGIIGLAYEGGTPFQAEVYFINQAKIIQTSFVVPYFDLYDSRYPDLGVPTAVRGKITFNIADYHEFIKLHRLANFDLATFESQVKDSVARYVKTVVANYPDEHNVSALQIERNISAINELVEKNIQKRFARDFGVNVTAVDISAIDVDKSSAGYIQLKAITQDIAAATTVAQAEMNIKNIHDMQRINMENIEETQRIQREEAQYAQRKQTQSQHFAAYQLEQQANVGIAGANALGQMGNNGATEISGGGGMNPAAMMTGMVMGGAIGQNMAGIMNGMANGLNTSHSPDGNSLQNGSVPPLANNESYYIVSNGQAVGPYTQAFLIQMISAGTLNSGSLVWKPGMENWTSAGSLPELSYLFESQNASMPPIPPIPKES